MIHSSSTTERTMLREETSDGDLIRLTIVTIDDLKPTFVIDMDGYEVTMSEPTYCVLLRLMNEASRLNEIALFHEDSL